MGWQSWIVGFDNENQKIHILTIIKQHNEIYNTPVNENSNLEEVGEELINFTETTLKTIYKATPLKDKTRAILFGNSGGRADTCQFLMRNKIIPVEYTTAIGKRLNGQLPIDIEGHIIEDTTQ